MIIAFFDYLKSVSHQKQQYAYKKSGFLNKKLLVRIIISNTFFFNFICAQRRPSFL